MGSAGFETSSRHRSPAGEMIAAWPLETCAATLGRALDAGLNIVDTAPGWVHDVTNVGSDELIVLVWANEQFDPTRPDTVPAKVSA